MHSSCKILQDLHFLASFLKDKHFSCKLLASFLRIKNFLTEKVLQDIRSSCKEQILLIWGCKILQTISDDTARKNTLANLHRRNQRPISLNITGKSSVGGREESIMEDRESPTSDYNTCYGEGDDAHLPGYVSPSNTFPTTILETDELAAVEEGMNEFRLNRVVQPHRKW